MRVSYTVHCFRDFKLFQQEVCRPPGTLLQRLSEASGTQFVQLGRYRFRVELIRSGDVQHDARLVEVPFGTMTVRQQLSTIVRRLRSLLPGKSSAKPLEYRIGAFKQAAGTGGLAPIAGFMPRNSKLDWLCQLCRAGAGCTDVGADIPASLRLHGVKASVEDLKIVQEHLSLLPPDVTLGDLEMLLEALCSLTFPTDKRARSMRDVMIARLCAAFCDKHEFDLAVAKRLLKAAAGVPIGQGFERWAANGAKALVRKLADAPSPHAHGPLASALGAVAPGTVDGLLSIRQSLLDLAFLMPAIGPRAKELLEHMRDIAAVPYARDEDREALRAIVARAEARWDGRLPQVDQSISPGYQRRVWGKPAAPVARAGA